MTLTQIADCAQRKNLRNRSSLIGVGYWSLLSLVALRRLIPLRRIWQGALSHFRQGLDRDDCAYSVGVMTACWLWQEVLFMNGLIMGYRISLASSLNRA